MTSNDFSILFECITENARRDPVHIIEIQFKTTSNSKHVQSIILNALKTKKILHETNLIDYQHDKTCVAKFAAFAKNVMQWRKTILEMMQSLPPHVASAREKSLETIIQNS